MVNEQFPQSEQPQPVPLYENTILTGIAETDDRLRNLLNGLRVSDNLVRKHEEEGNRHLAQVIAVTREQVEADARQYLQRERYAWEEQFPEPPEEP